jgi:hypothetical protein
MTSYLAQKHKWTHVHCAPMGRCTVPVFILDEFYWLQLIIFHFTLEFYGKFNAQ